MPGSIARKGLNPLEFLSAVPTRIRVSGNSMTPFLEDGDEADVIAAVREDFNEGDLIVFGRGEDLIVHRIIKAAKDSFMEMGDNQGAGSWMEWQARTGKVMSVLKKDGTAFRLDDEAQIERGRAIARSQRIRHMRNGLEDMVRLRGLKRLVRLPFKVLEFFVSRKCLL